MVPIVGGQEISTDNTCKGTVALREFFDGGALRALNAYREALVFDIGLLEAGNWEYARKANRLAQIEAYIEAVRAMRFSFGDAMTAFHGRPSNLYSIQLRPRVQDSLSSVVNPVFSLNRKNNAAGIPLSPLYNAMHNTFPTTVIATSEPRTKLTTAVLSEIPPSASFEDIQKALGEQSLVLFGLPIDFTKCTDGTPSTKEMIDGIMGFGDDATLEDYINALLGACALNIWETLPTPLFYSIQATTSVDERTERLSILTQFFLANLNVYCKAKGISDKNFGMILDVSPDLSHGLVRVVSAALTSGTDVESAICDFCNRNEDKFHLSHLLSAQDLSEICQKFERTYRTVTATNENPHMDDFMILDFDVSGEKAKCFTHQGSICVNFAHIIDPIAASSNPDYFAKVRDDFTVHPAELSHRNESVSGGHVEVDVETIIAGINDGQFEKLPAVVKEACRADPSFQVHHLLDDVAKGKQGDAEALLTAMSTNTQTFLRTPGIFTDYSCRTFNCTAYEYAYWAKDTQMCRMLESYMDKETKAHVLACVVANDASGLSYQQNGAEHRSAHFDLTALIEALKFYITNYDTWFSEHKWSEMDNAVMKIGDAQRDVPAHVAQEYCREDRSFYPCPNFDEPTLPRRLTFRNWTITQDDFWFPLRPNHSGIGFDMAVHRGANSAGACAWRRAGPEGGGGWWLHEKESKNRDLTAVSRLDAVRTAELSELYEHLIAPNARIWF